MLRCGIFLSLINRQKIPLLEVCLNNYEMTEDEDDDDEVEIGRSASACHNCHCGGIGALPPHKVCKPGRVSAPLPALLPPLLLQNLSKVVFQGLWKLQTPCKQTCVGSRIPLKFVQCVHVSFIFRLMVRLVQFLYIGSFCR